MPNPYADQHYQSNNPNLYTTELFGTGPLYDAFASRKAFLIGAVFFSIVWIFTFWVVNPDKPTPGFVDSLGVVIIMFLIFLLVTTSAVAVLVVLPTHILDEMLLVGPKPGSPLWMTMNTKFESTHPLTVAIMGILVTPFYLLLVLPKELVRHPAHVISVVVKRLCGNKDATLEFGRKRYWYKQVRMMRKIAQANPQLAKRFLFESSIGAHYGLEKLNQMAVFDFDTWDKEGWREDFVKQMTQRYGQPA